ncbi:MAG: hypothetical protein ACLR2G_07870 [Phascolarctobacterium faecium]
MQRVVWLVSRHMRFAPMLVTGERTLLRWLRSGRPAVILKIVMK